MDVIIALVFISLTLVAAGLLFFFTRLFEGDFEHGERLSLLPLEDDTGMKEIDPEINGDNLVRKSSNDENCRPVCDAEAKEEGAPNGSNEHADEDGRL